jgi:hypothetical protein
LRVRPALAATLTLSTAAAGVTVALATPSARPTAVAAVGLPSGAPPAAHQAEPRLPVPHGWPFADAFPRTSGTGRLAGGASYWTDFVYDDHGALGVEHAAPTADLAPTIGTYTYPAGPASGNGADIFRAAVGLTSDASYWRVDWTTLVNANVPIAEWTLDTDNNAATGATKWAAGAGVQSPGIERELVVSSRGARLINALTGGTLAPLPVSVDMAARSFVVRVPRSVLPIGGSWQLRLAAGLADASGKSFAPVPAQRGALPSEPAVYNVTFRTVQQEAASCATCGTPDLKPVGHGAQAVDANFWNESNQAATLARGNVSKFHDELSWGALAAHRTTPEPQPTGYSDRWYVTTLNLGNGVVANGGGARGGAGDLRPNFLSRIQPYGVYVPHSYKRGTPTPLTWVLHSLGVNHNQYGGLDPNTMKQLCDDRDSICATTLGFGPDGWYFDEAEVDFWQVWHQLANAFTLDPTRTIISGYSMGGFASYKLGLTYPDMFAAAMPLAGPPTCGVRVVGSLRETAGAGPCADDGDTQPLVPNARWLPYDLADGVADELVPYSSVLEQVRAFSNAGLRYRFATYPVADHLGWALEDDWSSEIDALGHPTVMRDPGTIHYGWYPNGSNPAFGLGPTGVYWVRNLHARTSKPGQLAIVDAASGARPVAPHNVVKSRSASIPGDPRPGVVITESWQAVPKPMPKPRATLSLVLTDVGSLAVDPIRAGFRPGQHVTVTVRTDGPTTFVFGLVVVHLPTGVSTFTV